MINEPKEIEDKYNQLGKPCYVCDEGVFEIGYDYNYQKYLGHPTLCAMTLIRCNLCESCNNFISTWADNAVFMTCLSMNPRSMFYTYFNCDPNTVEEEDYFRNDDLSLFDNFNFSDYMEEQL